MTRFSEYQIRRFRLIFNQYAEYAACSTESVFRSETRSLLLSPSKSSILEDTQEGAQQELRRLHSKNSFYSLGSQGRNSNLRLTSAGLNIVLDRFGPSLSSETIRSIILRYDTNCCGTLDFEDFLIFLGDYALTIERKRRDALRIYAHRKHDLVPVIQKSSFHPSSHAFILKVLNDATNGLEFLNGLKLDDPELLWSSEDSLTTSIWDSGLVLSYPFLNRFISLHVVNAENVDTFARLKFRKDEGFVFNSLDPFVKISFCGKSKQTSALLNTLHPYWDQEINFEFSIFPGEAMDVLQWAMTQYFEISLYDLTNDGPLAHGELLAYASVPIAPILFSIQRPLELNVALQCCDGFDRDIKLNLHSTDKSAEQFAFPKLMDACLPIEQYWIKNFSEKMKLDFHHEIPSKSPHYLRRPPALDISLKKNQAGVLTLGDFFEYYESTMKKLSNLLPQRNFAVLGLDELNCFRLLPSFLNTVPLPGNHSCDEIAVYVSEIPFYTPIHPHSDITLNILKKLPGPVLEKFRVPSAPLSYSHAKPLSISETRFSRISVPVSFISRGYGTLMDHALLLCSFFLALDINAYVAVGSIHERFHVWVVSFEGSVKYSYPPSPLIVTESQRYDTNEKDNLSILQITEEYAYKKILQQTSFKNSSLNIKLWDLYTGIPMTMSNGHFPFFLSIHTLFNNKNLWMNVQASDFISRPIFSWDLTNPKAWIPFFTKDALVTFSPLLQTFYPHPNSFVNGFLSFSMEDESLLNELNQLIADYRLAHLFMTTTINETFSNWLFEQIPELERSRRSRLPYPSLQPTPTLPKSSQFVHRFIFLRGSPSVQSIFHHVVNSGLVDCSVPGAAIAIQLRSYSYFLGLQCVWMGVGYLSKMK
ncbi:hypothetical protein HMI54_009164 [Coelomomyces lativittatus]|nr:hypothetical protein HMI56_003005 [Coelomomyces lativittatus]KAJ1516516.1 hypothetical protein HMI54_009164 [Coelomomyces lativittatus]KAJ1517553.1 hypothetical protein HMI55_006712 [Coelomomyces lativittatus]